MPSVPAAIVREFAPAKINLYLHVVGRRDDGYHLLDSLVVFAADGAGDVVTVEPADDLTLAIDGPFAAELPTDRNNLVLRAADALAAVVPPLPDGRPLGARPWGARITLSKHLPVASGIGGGSADAAAALRALGRLWGVSLPAAELAALALALGADLPMCLTSRPAFVGGVGERIDPAPPLPPCWLVLANPGVALPTPQVFRSRRGAFSVPARFDRAPADAAHLAALLADRNNDLTAAAIALCPVIADVLNVLYGCPGALVSRMSGSGASCFALFADAGGAMAAAEAVRRQQDGWWVTAARVAGAEDSV